MTQRQEAVNVVLAQLLVQRGLAAAPEQILSASDHAIKMPDVLVDFQGLRMAIEAEFEGETKGSKRDARNKAFAKAETRVVDGVAHIGVAIVYPVALKKLAWDQIAAQLAVAELHYTVVNEATVLEAQLHLFDDEKSDTPFYAGNIDNFIDAIRRSYDRLVTDDTLERAVRLVETGIGQVSFALRTQPATTIRMADALGVGDYNDKNGQLKPRYRDPINRISSLIIVNALIFHEVLAKKHPNVRPLSNFAGRPNALAELADHWEKILRDINYFPIFATADQLLRCISTDSDFSFALKALIETALKVASWRASLRHDLAGRIFHRLLEEAKFLGAYYTAIPSAALLLKLALDSRTVACHWNSIADVGALRIADLACGTGTLLMAAADVLTDNYVRACAAHGEKPEVALLQKELVQHVIHGYDVLPSAVHLTASTLTLRVPDMPVDVTHLYAMPLGGPEHALGTLEFMADRAAPGRLFGIVEQIAGKGKRTSTSGIPPLDLCVMNPPFTRSVGGNLLFGNLPDGRAEMQKRLKRLVQQHKFEANITAGLGSVFVALGEHYIKPGGCLALVLPRALISGPAWRKSRSLIEKRFVLEYVITCDEPGHWNFSENTSLSEVLVVARRFAGKKASAASSVKYIHLIRQPRTAIEALALVSKIASSPAPDIATAHAAENIDLGERKFGELSSISWTDVKSKPWSLGAPYCQFELNKIFYHLLRGSLVLPSLSSPIAIPLAALGDLVEFGYDTRDVHDAFKLSSAATSYPAIWSHKAAASASLAHVPNRWLAPRTDPIAGRKLKSASAVFAKAGQMLFAERMRLNTVQTVAVFCNQPVISNSWWVAKPKAALSIEAQKALILWQNSTIGLILLVGSRVETEGGWVKFKKPTMETMATLDVSKIPEASLSELANSFDRLQKQDLSPIRSALQDRIRKAIDEELSKSLGLSGVASLRELLCREPVLSQVAL